MSTPPPLTDDERPHADPTAGLIALAADWTWEQDAAGRHTGWTALPSAPAEIAATTVLGRTREELDERGETDAAAWAAYRQALEHPATFRDLITRVRSKAGSWRYISASGCPVFGTDGAYAGHRGIARDVTRSVQRELRGRLEHKIADLVSQTDTLAKAARLVMQSICATLSWDCGAYWEYEQRDYAEDDAAGGSGMVRCAQTYSTSPATVAFLSTMPPLDPVNSEGRGLVRAAFGSGKPVWIGDIAGAAGFTRGPAAARAGLCSAFAFPVKLGKRVVGVMEFFSRHMHEADTELMQWACDVAVLLARYVQLAEARAQSAQSEARLRSLIDLSSDWIWEQDEALRFSRVEISEQSLRAMRDKGWVGPVVPLGSRPWDMPALNLNEEDWALHRAQLKLHAPFYDFEIRRPDYPNGEPRWLSVSGVPVHDEAGRFVGYRGIGRDISARKQTEQRVTFLANHDPLTQLPNRTLFNEILTRSVLTAQRYQRRFAVFFMDLDRFKRINDSLGHDAGDTLLREVARRLTTTLRTSDVIARMGGDEFVMLVQESKTQADLEVVANNVLSALQKPVTLLGQECRISGSIGICVYPDQASDAPTLIKHADAAMYQAKEEGKNQFRFYSENTMPPQTLERMALESSLRHAIERGELFLHYQAKQDMKTRRVCGVEALLRWRHPELGVVPPLKFIPLAEESGLIVPIGKWVLQTACAQNVAWQRAGHEPLSIAVNLSARQFLDEYLLDDIRDALAATGMQAQYLELELTESMVIHNPQRALAVLEEIKKMGARIAIDDFGTGYSSLTQLKNFPIDTLKVDRSFIRDLQSNQEDRAMTKAIIAMGKTLGLTVVAEGVETEAQQAFLGENACDQIQGYVFSRPLDPEHVPALLRAHQPEPAPQPA